MIPAAKGIQMSTSVQVIIDGRTVNLSGRAAAIVTWLSRQRERALLDGWPCVKVVISCAGSKFKPIIEIFPDEVSI